MRRVFGSLSARVLLALVLGLVVGALAQTSGDAGVTRAVGFVEPLGGLWLNALRMTVIPLVVSLLVTGIASIADAAATGRLAARAIGLFLLIMAAAAVYSVAFCAGALALFPVDPGAAARLLQGVNAAPAEVARSLDVGAWIQSLAPSNVFTAAANDAILPLTVFACVLGFAATRLSPDLRRPFVTLFQATAEAMVVIVHWVLLAAPIGVFALALGVGLRTGFDAAGLIGHYILLVCAAQIVITLLFYPFTAWAGRMSIGRFAAAAAPVQALAISTQSSLACLPAMVERSRESLDVPPQRAGLLLPLAVAIFRMTSTVANLAVVMFVASLYGVQPSLFQMGAAVLVAVLVGVGSVGLPGQVSFFAAIAPICLAIGIPVDVLPILLAVEVIPDIFRTIGNVTADLSVTRILGRGAPETLPEAPHEAGGAPVG